MSVVVPTLMAAALRLYPTIPVVSRSQVDAPQLERSYFPAQPWSSLTRQQSLEAATFDLSSGRLWATAVLATLTTQSARRGRWGGLCTQQA